MEIESATYTERGDIAVVIEGRTYTVPDDMSNRHRRALAEWEAAGNAIGPYVAPPPPTDEERLDAAFFGSDTGKLLFKVLLDSENRTRALEGKNAISATQYRTALKAVLNSL